MKVAVRKLQVEDAAKLQMLVAENIDAIEPGLVVLDSRLLLGHATIDVVGLDVDCVEFRLLDVEGAPAVYFESILRLRRPVVTPAATPRAETPADAPAVAENVIAMNGPVAARATSLKLQKLLNQAAAESPHGAPRAAERPVTMSR